MLHRGLIGRIGAISHNHILFNAVNKRMISQSSVLRAEEESANTSIFGSLTKNVDMAKPAQDRLSDRMIASADNNNTGEDAAVEEQKFRDSITVETDVLLQKHIQKLDEPEKPAVNLYLSPLKRRIYEQNCKDNGGFFKKNAIVRLPSTKEEYRLTLNQQELDALEPSVYLQSYRLKSSMKKTTQVLRMINGIDLKKAITQCHFSKRHVAKEIEELLKRGIEDAQKLKLDPNDLYISQIWCGSDGSWRKNMEFKGRGRVGIISHPWVHVRCILKTKSVTKKRLEFEKDLKELKKKPWIQLPDKPVRGVTNNVYKW
ncbi:hypothetical protein TPHA_0O01570 [Tetrapisispora phaffii CBS 4417]|uniref:Ribosomal protein L22 n=1 Tax=Tetrapisispora phaffii (strain ATCC 24235 / CBS 4417 / NBRC 1672 / NRRL Y-8282 / UCD 70-5) TaxID=1071381 RepID=G8C1U6_TETPH|nr:mitochondrial 54S ribosomal protein YmL22 TPHA_0O01570 [Tetrapisispora phaffii CBS 4417]CCE66124.1 hypothetical protein TPHA_0O01570 [Tetrapisispora phaffii CBS 4417]